MVTELDDDALAYHTCRNSHPALAGCRVHSRTITLSHTVLLPWPNSPNSPRGEFSSLADESMSLGELVARSNVTTVSYIPARERGPGYRFARAANTLSPERQREDRSTGENDRSE